MEIDKTGIKVDEIFIPFTEICNICTNQQMGGLVSVSVVNYKGDEFIVKTNLRQDELRLFLEYFSREIAKNTERNIGYLGWLIAHNGLIVPYPILVSYNREERIKAIDWCFLGTEQPDFKVTCDENPS